MQSHTHRMHVCLAVTCHLHFRQNDQDFFFLHATAVTTDTKIRFSTERVTLEKEILPPLLLGLEPTTFWSQVPRSNHWAIPTPCYSQYEKGKWCVQNIVELFSTALFHFQCEWWSSFSALNIYLSLMFLLCHLRFSLFVYVAGQYAVLPKTTAKKGLAASTAEWSLLSLPACVSTVTFNFSSCVANEDM